MIRLLLLAALLLAIAPVRAFAQTTCTLDSCGKYLPDGIPEKPCACVGSQPGCCRYPKGCVCEPECKQFGDCCRGMEGVCDHPVVTSITPTTTVPPPNPALKGKSAKRPAPRGPMFLLKGVGLGGTWLQVKHAGRPCEVLEHRSDHIVFALPEGAAATGSIIVIVDGRSAAPAPLPAPATGDGINARRAPAPSTPPR